MKFLLLLLGCMSLTSFFFESTFDCKIPKGLKCKSLYERQAKAVQGVDVVNKSPKKPKKYLINLFKSKQSQGERKHT
ncbi:Uncharacterised protein [Orientia tsutsugamushi]|uniref:Conjugative transfer protein n=1 Tax=Orientia tsutsugamushi TaxID=784 RepID=A0A2R8F1Q0_ORITS|nr:conjugal transfer protein [Orientia tsutsugamushi]SPM44631.1 Uncharacterised protein [Orientia tsutsugamushi]SPM45350.1 Uncharacterised protein [Orientia tsutsugamushi]SPM45961.1 Uncharacterised protein [Orientia tsutsugamushi]